MSIILDSDAGMLILRIWRLYIEYRRYVRLHHDRRMSHWNFRWVR